MSDRDEHIALQRLEDLRRRQAGKGQPRLDHTAELKRDARGRFLPMTESEKDALSNKARWAAADRIVKHSKTGGHDTSWKKGSRTKLEAAADKLEKELFGDD
jgi:hypothetical protein